MLWQTFTITKLEITNFKRFFGHHEIDLSTQPEEGKTIVLIGGENGRGKTSIYEAVNYALYIDSDLQRSNARWRDYRSTMSWPDYRTAVSERLNRQALDLGFTDYSVALEIKAVQLGQERTFRIERLWEVDVRQRKIIKPPVLKISEKGTPLTDVPEKYYQDFLRDLLPPGVAPYFFFDGARIEAFAEDDNVEHSKVMSDAIQNILHIDVYRRLKSDLRKYVEDPLEQEIQGSEQNDKMHDLEKEIEEIDSEIASKERRIRNISEEQEEQAHRKKLLAIELRGYQHQSEHAYEDLIAENEGIEAALDVLKKDLESAAYAIPLVLAGTLLNQLASQLQKEEQLQDQGKQTDLQKKLNQLEERLFVGPPPFPPEKALTDTQENYLRSRFQETTEDLFLLKSEQDGEKIHDIGNSERFKILQRLSDVDTTSQTVRGLLDRREQLYSGLRTTKQKLGDLSENPEIPRLLKQSDELSEHIGALKNEQEQNEFDIHALSDKKNSLQREREKYQKERKATNKKKGAVKLALEAQDVLQEFVKRLAPEKLKLLQAYFEEMYWMLRKPDEDPVKSVTIDPDTWSVTLLDDAGNPVKFGFSAGMKEMYALSLIWALSKASGRNLPIIIDFPGGHLDVYNFSAFLNKFLPNAGHQVIVLSTDREIDAEVAQTLSPHVAKMYRLDWEPSSKSTVIRRGYFETAGKT